jgi:hypothetical protein
MVMVNLISSSPPSLSAWDVEIVRPQSSRLNSDTPYPNIIAVKLADPSQIDIVKARLLATISNIEVTDIRPPSTTSLVIQPSKGRSDTGFLHAIDRRAGHRRVFPDSDSAKVPQIGVLKRLAPRTELSAGQR